MSNEADAQRILNKEERRLEQQQALADASKEKVKQAMVESLKAGTGKNLAKQFLEEARNPKPLSVDVENSKFGGYAEVTGLGDTPWIDPNEDDEF